MFLTCAGSTIGSRRKWFSFVDSYQSGQGGSDLETPSVLVGSVETPAIIGRCLEMYEIAETRTNKMNNGADPGKSRLGSRHMAPAIRRPVSESITGLCRLSPPLSLHCSQNICLWLVWNEKIGRCGTATSCEVNADTLEEMERALARDEFLEL